MRIVGARFNNEDSAFEALVELRGRYAIDADVRPLGTTEYGIERRDESILAARMDPDVAPQVEQVVEQLGGEVLIVRDEPGGYDPSRAA